MEHIKQLIIDAFDKRDQINSNTDDDELREAVRYVIDEIDRGGLSGLPKRYQVVGRSSMAEKSRSVVFSPERQ